MEGRGGERRGGEGRGGEGRGGFLTEMTSCRTARNDCKSARTIAAGSSPRAECEPAAWGGLGERGILRGSLLLPLEFASGYSVPQKETSEWTEVLACSGYGWGLEVGIGLVLAEVAWSGSGSDISSEQDESSEEVLDGWLP